MDLAEAIRLVLADDREQDPDRAYRTDAEIVGELRDSVDRAEIDYWVESETLTAPRLSWAYYAVIDASGDAVAQALPG